MTAAAIDLFSALMCLAWDGSVRVEDRRPAGGGASEGWTVTMFHAETGEDVRGGQWEMHAEGDETVGVMRGGVRVIVRAPFGSATEDDPTFTLRQGEAFVVPRGTWHRLEVDAPSDLVSVTWRRGTLLEKGITARKSS